VELDWRKFARRVMRPCGHTRRPSSAPAPFYSTYRFIKLRTGFSKHLITAHLSTFFVSTPRQFLDVMRHRQGFRVAGTMKAVGPFRAVRLFGATGMAARFSGQRRFSWYVCSPLRQQTGGQRNRTAKLWRSEAPRRTRVLHAGSREPERIMVEFLSFYFMSGVYIAGGVLACSAIVATVEKLIGIDPRPLYQIRMDK
jgi:hypothetical protein